MPRFTVQFRTTPTDFPWLVFDEWRRTVVTAYSTHETANEAADDMNMEFE